MLTDKDFEIFPCHFIQDSNIRAGLNGLVELALFQGADPGDNGGKAKGEGEDELPEHAQGSNQTGSHSISHLAGSKSIRHKRASSNRMEHQVGNGDEQGRDPPREFAGNGDQVFEGTCALSCHGILETSPLKLCSSYSTYIN